MVRSSKAGRYYAMKICSDHYLRQKGHMNFYAADVLIREAEILQAIQHPRMPGYVEHFLWENMYCLVQEYMPGNTLSTLINQGYQFEEKEVRLLLLELLNIVNFLHRLADEKKPAVVHRDLRLSNLILSDNGLSLIDFGLAHRMQNDADEAFLGKGCRLNAAANASPSYARMRNDLTIHCDLFGAGVVAVDLFTNSIISDASTSWEQRILISPSFKAFIRKLLGVDGNFVSAAEAIEHLLSLE